MPNFMHTKQTHVQRCTTQAEKNIEAKVSRITYSFPPRCMVHIHTQSLPEVSLLNSIGEIALLPPAK